VKVLPKRKGRQPIGGQRKRELFEAKDYSCTFVYKRETICNKPPMHIEIAGISIKKNKKEKNIGTKSTQCKLSIQNIRMNGRK